MAAATRNGFNDDLPDLAGQEVQGGNVQPTDILGIINLRQDAVLVLLACHGITLHHPGDEIFEKRNKDPPAPTLFNVFNSI
jgi:hypothetical protein